MSISTVIFNLDERLRSAGCPICQVYEISARRYVQQLHWEFINDPTARERFLASWGYCPEHTRLVATIEQEMYNDWMGTSILYESLSRFVRRELAERQPRPRRSRPWDRLIESALGAFHRSKEIIPGCHICELAETSTRNALAALLEGMEAEPSRWNGLYDRSDGLCLAHLRSAIANENERFPAALDHVLQHRLYRLDAEMEHMQEYVRKHAWEYRHEPKTQEETLAWQINLGFFMGHPLDPTIPGRQE